MKLLLVVFAIMGAVDCLAGPAHISGLEKMYFRLALPVDSSSADGRDRPVNPYLPESIDTACLFRTPHWDGDDINGVQIRDFVLPFSEVKRFVVLRQLATVSELRINPITLALYDGSRRSDIWYYEANWDSTDGKMLPNYRIIDVRPAGPGVIVFCIFGEMFRPHGAWWVEGKLAHFNVTANGLAFKFLENCFGFNQPYDPEGQLGLCVYAEELIGDTLVKRIVTEPVLDSCGPDIDVYSGEDLSLGWAEWAKYARCIVSNSNAVERRRSISEPSFYERDLSTLSNHEPSGPGAIHEGFFWQNAEVSAGSMLVALETEDVLSILRFLSGHLTSLSPHGWFPGIPNRTLTLRDLEIRIVYGGSTGDEFGVCSHSGTVMGFFRSSELLTLLDSIEARLERHK